MAIGTIISSLIGPILGPLIDLIPNKNERERAKEQAEAQIVSAMSNLVEGQLKINEMEAQHGSVFVAGARPAVMWICGAGLAWNFVIKPIMMWLSFLYGLDLEGAPDLDTSELTTILLGMLGLGGLRTYEKSIGVARNAIVKKEKD